MGTDRQIRVKNPYGVFSVKVLQKIKVSFIEHLPLINQLKTISYRMIFGSRTTRLKYGNIVNYIDNPLDLWIDGVSRSDRVNYHFYKKMGKL